ncbi:cutinase family protein [Corynebacterium aquatimens]|uniref:Cutinase n=1 Tax=Corynebacterium aquatimens TaxID=1190508 RepID=A0A931E0Q1_9CORY|nr:cutinase family protein [Corynebacterium aquatimens]MBG6121611.1 hypothetical protein [Corynebacterium aquatimens]WJY65849.1 Cutinase [Corynebacterium aquatimens]
MKLGRPALFLSALALLPVAAPAHADEPAATCPAVDIVSVVGSFHSVSNDDPEEIRGVNAGRNFAYEMVERYPGKVTAWQVPYPSTVTIMGSSLHSRKGDGPERGLPYGASVKEGVKNGTAHMSELAARCPSTKFILDGYSQGATVAGDIVAAVGQGEVPGVTPEKILAAYLIADPGRSALTGQTVALRGGAEGQRLATGEILVTLDQGAPPAHYVGATGPRFDGAFSPFDDRVLTFCGPKDPACSTAPGRLPNQVAQVMNEWRDAPDHQAAVAAGLKDPKVVGVLLLIAVPVVFFALLGIFAPIPGVVESASQISGLNPGQQAALRALAAELRTIGDLAHRFNQNQSLVGAQELPALAEDVDKLSTDSGSSTSSRITSAALSQFVKALNHLHYFTDFRLENPQNSAEESSLRPLKSVYDHNAYRVGGTVVDTWIRDDMDARIRQT